MNKKIDFLTPVGRLVAGDVFRANTTDLQGRPLTIKNGPNAGKPKSEYFFAVAIKKDDAKFKTDVMDKLTEAARVGFPTMFDNVGKCTREDFAWKIVDGDSTKPNMAGVAPSTKEGYKGCFVISFKGGFAPKAYSQDGTTVLTDPESIKKGYFIRVQGSVTPNGSIQKPGLYLNPLNVQLVGYGDVISGAQQSVFVDSAPLPAGASAAPLHVDFLNPPKTYTFNGNLYTEKQLIDLGWTPDLIKTLG